MGENRSKKMKSDLMTKDEVSKILRLSKSDLKEFESEGLFDYADKAKRKIDHRNFERLKVALSLKRDLGVNVQGIDVILHMREKMRRMQTDLNTLLIQIRRRLGQRIYRNLNRIQGKSES